MADIFSKAIRSRIMSSIRGKDTKPEMTVRRALYSLGLRYKLHDRRLPGTPDLVFLKYKTVVFVNGCWWHQHDCGKFKPPRSNLRYWGPKIRKNRENTIRNLESLHRLGWRVIEVWECQLKTMDWGALVNMIRDWSIVIPRDRRADLSHLGDR